MHVVYVFLVFLSRVWTSIFTAAIIMKSSLTTCGGEKIRQSFEGFLQNLDLTFVYVLISL